MLSRLQIPNNISLMVVVLLSTACSSSAVSPSVSPAQNEPGVLPDALVRQGFRLLDVEVDKGNDGTIDERYILQYDVHGLEVGELIDADADGVHEHSFRYTYVDGRLDTSSFDRDLNGMTDVLRTFEYDDNHILRTLVITALMSGEPDRRVSYRLDETGVIMSSASDDDNDGHVDTVSQYQRDGQNRIIRIDIDNDGDEVRDLSVSFSYDSEGRVTGSDTDLGVDGTIDSHSTYHYEAALCDPSSNHQPLDHSCVFP